MKLTSGAPRDEGNEGMVAKRSGQYWRPKRRQVEMMTTSSIAQQMMMTA